MYFELFFYQQIKPFRFRFLKVKLTSALVYWFIELSDLITSTARQ